MAGFFGHERVLPEWPAADVGRLVRAPMAAAVPRKHCLLYRVHRTGGRVYGVFAPHFPDHLFLHGDVPAEWHRADCELRLPELFGAGARNFSAGRRLSDPRDAQAMEEAHRAGARDSASRAMAQEFLCILAARVRSI